MDIAKIRKKAKEQEAEKRERSSPEPSGGEAPPGTPLKTEEKAETLEQSVPEEPAHPGPEQSAASKPQEQSEGDREKGEEKQIELLTFRLANEEFAFRVAEVEEIIRPQKITKVPTMPDYVIGITSLRGKVIPVIDLKARLNLKRAEDAGGDEKQSEDKLSGTKILIIEGPKGFIGAVIDRVVGVVRLSEDEVLEPPAHLTEAEMKLITGIVILDKRFISVVRSEDAMSVDIG